MTLPTKADVSAIPGGALGATTAEELRAEITSIDSLDIKEGGQLIASRNDWNTSARTDTEAQAKYPSQGDTSYLAGGALSISPTDGRLKFISRTNENNRPALDVDQTKSSLLSSANSTVLGTLKISTLDGHELNPLSPVIPSTPFSPIKPWNKQLFPDFTRPEFISVIVLQTALLLLSQAGGDRNTITETSETIDMGRIVIDNQEIEDEWFDRK